MAVWVGDPWDRQKKESGAAYEAFCIYRDLGFERKLIRVAERLHKSYSIIRRWNTEYNWDERVRAYDSYLQSVEIEQRRKKQKQANDRAYTAANALYQKALECLANMTDADLKKTGLKGVANVLKTAMDIQRKATEPTREEILRLEQEMQAEAQATDWAAMVEAAYEYDAAREDDTDDAGQ